MQKLVIIGGGFAGFWSAMSAVRQARALGKCDELKISLISKDQYHSIRPRFYEADLASMRLPLIHHLTALNVGLIVGEVSSIDPDRQRIHLTGQAEGLVYDTMILSAGSTLKSLAIPGIEHAFNVDTFHAATALDRHLHRLAITGFSTSASRTVVVIGGGFTGLEVVTALPQRLGAYAPNRLDFRLILLDRCAELASNYSPDARQYIADQLAAANIEVWVKQEAERIETDRLTLKSGHSIATETVIRTTGLEASPLTATLKGERDELGRLLVDRFLRVPGYDNIFAAGDAAKALVDSRHYAVMSCQHAIPQGKFAGHNAINALFGRALKPYSQPRYVTCLDLGTSNALFTVDWTRNLKLSGQPAKALKNEIVTQWIYPPADAEETIKLAVPEILAPS